MNWKTIRLELARSRDFPAGSVGRGYLIRVPLENDGSVDEQELARSPHKATVRRFWSSEPDRSGAIVKAGGHLVLRCNGDPDRLLPLGAALDKLDSQVSLVEPDGVSVPFRIASVRQFA